ncbi:S10 family serine carboxypeptidase-like protein [Paraburkholderia flava]|uniref:S10 family serine carboxypeptidase-like protein n=1 Tax=Paraburkholderia flava TaxID=2547393 RepID=UPI0014151086|nr:peptidase S10 [Paraburkholderia flava]
MAVALLSGCGGDDKISSPTEKSASPASPASSPAALSDQRYADPNTYSSNPNDSLPSNSAFDQAAVTHHTITLNGKAMNYTATAGHLTAVAPNADKSKPADNEVSFFYVAYTRDNQPLGTRPVTFFWNGGPGSSTIWLHLGSWGPKTFQVDEASFTPDQLQTQPTSFPLVDNDVSMLDDTDLVFVDAPGTGFSEAIAPHKNKDFWGVDQDTKAFRDFIARYIAVNKRQTSPKYLYGESYGGIRTPIVADLLEQAGSPGQGGPALTGVILNSPILSYKTNCDMSGDVSCEGYVPTYGAVAYSKKVATDPLAASSTLPDYVSQMRFYVAQYWAPSLVPYLSLPYKVWDPSTDTSSLPSDVQAVIKTEQTVFSALAAKTGLTTANWALSFNMQPSDFQSDMLTRLGLGSDSSHMDRYNGMVTIPVSATYDAQSYNDLAFQNEITDFLPSFLGYTSKSKYALEPNAPINMWNWKHGTDKSNHPTSLPDLTDALTLDPKLKVVVFHGYHDLACPLHQSELDLGGAGLASTVPIKAFPGGHMIYLTKDSRQPMKQAIDSFFGTASTATVAAR